MVIMSSPGIQKMTNFTLQKKIMSTSFETQSFQYHAHAFYGLKLNT